MATATITSKGQITIPAVLRSELHVGPGDKVEFVKVAEGRYEVLAVTKDISALRGMVKATGVVSVEEMDTAIKARAGQR